MSAKAGPSLTMISTDLDVTLAPINVQCCPRQIAVHRYECDEQMNGQTYSVISMTLLRIASSQIRHIVYTRGAVARPSDVVLSAICLSSVA